MNNPSALKRILSKVFWKETFNVILDLLLESHLATVSKVISIHLHTLPAAILGQ